MSYPKRKIDSERDIYINLYGGEDRERERERERDHSD